jgi:LCP family protein required for cell wall assembly
MRFEEERRPKRRRRGCLARLLGFLTKLVLFALALALIAGAVLYALPVGLFMIEPKAELSPAGDLPTGRINVLLLGVDKLADGVQRADTIIVATIGYDAFNLTSVMRDTMVDIPGHGRQKANAAYAHGGPELAMRTLNENFGLNITKYVVVDFLALADLVNAIGGVDMAITQSEQTEINRNIYDSRKIFKAAGYTAKDTSAVELDFSKADEEGYVQTHLDGIQALGYARIRRTDSDITRAHRQRKLLNAALHQFRTQWYNPLALYRLSNAALSRIDTNMNAVELLSIGIKAALRPDAGQLRLPIEGSYRDNGSALVDINYQRNREAFVEFAY